MNDNVIDPFATSEPEAEPPSETPEPGETYQRLPGEPVFQVVHVEWQHPNHRLWAGLRVARELAPPFYVRTPSGEIAWVPWPGSKVVSQQDAAWPMDLVSQPAAHDPKTSKK